MSQQVEWAWDLADDQWGPGLEVATWGGEAPSVVLSDPTPQASAAHPLNQPDRPSGEEPDAKPQLPLASGSSLPEHCPRKLKNAIAAFSSTCKPSLKSRLEAVEVQCVPFALFSNISMPCQPVSVINVIAFHRLCKHSALRQALWKNDSD